MTIPATPAPMGFYGRHAKAIWWAAALFVPVVFLGMTLIWLDEGQWGFALNTLAFAGCSVLWTYNGVQNFRRGYRRGMDDFAEAGLRAQSKEEFLRLTIDAPPPKPWQ